MLFDRAEVEDVTRVLRGNDAVVGVWRNGLTPINGPRLSSKNGMVRNRNASLPRLFLDLLFFHAAKDRPLTIAITAIIMPTIAPTGRPCVEWELPAPMPVRLGMVVSVENEGSNVM